MTPFSELVLLALSFGTLGSWNREYSQMTQDDSAFDSPDQSDGAPESRSLYDLMQHFPLDEAIKCPESDARFRYPGECTRYVTCRNFEAHIRSCPPGMNFDQRSGHCRLAFDVDCDVESSPAYECESNEEYYFCGTSCESTCDNMHEMIECQAGCEEGCKCRLGYVRDRKGDCVKQYECDNVNSLFNIMKKHYDN